MTTGKLPEPRKPFIDRITSRRHLAFWALLASVATVVGVAIPIAVRLASGSSGSPQQSSRAAQLPGTHPATASGSPVAVNSSAPGAEASQAAGKVYLSTLNPVAHPYANVDAGPVVFGTTTYPHSIRFTCEGGQSSVTYQVAGYSYLDAAVDVPNDASNAAGHTAKVSFLKDGTTANLDQPLTVVLGKLQTLHLNLRGAAQVEIACVATDSSGGYQGMDIALGNALLS